MSARFAAMEKRPVGACRSAVTAMAVLALGLKIGLGLSAIGVAIYFARRCYRSQGAAEA